jgi:hypothetical protein
VYVVLPALTTRWRRLVHHGTTRIGGALTDMRSAAGLGMGTLAFTFLLVPLQAATPYYLRDIEWSALRTARYPAWLRTEDWLALHSLGAPHPSRRDRLSSYELGNFVPPFSGRRCFLGHYALTIDSQSKRADVQRFFSDDASPEADAWRLALLRRWHIGYVLDTPFERTIGDFDPSTRPWLERIYVTGQDPEGAPPSIG